jgi:hypothetical protein
MTATAVAEVKASGDFIHSELPTPPTLLRNKMTASSTAQNNRPIDTAGWLASPLGFATSLHPNFATSEYFMFPASYAGSEVLKGMIKVANCFRLVSCFAQHSALNTEATCSPDASATWRYIEQDRTYSD